MSVRALERSVTMQTHKINYKFNNTIIKIKDLRKILKDLNIN